MSDLLQALGPAIALLAGVVALFVWRWRQERKAWRIRANYMLRMPLIEAEARRRADEILFPPSPPLTFCPRCWEPRRMTASPGDGNEGRRDCRFCGGSFTEQELAEVRRD